MPVLYVTEPYARVEKVYHSLEVTLNDEVLARAPIATISEVILVGNVGITTPAMHALLAAEKPLALLRWSGEFLGRLTAPTGKNLALRKKQYLKASEPEFALRIARQVARGKTLNQRALVRRWIRERPEVDGSALDSLAGWLKKIDQADDLDSLRGYEGNTARVHFEMLEALLDNRWGFHKRARRPPPDPINALLSLGYSLLCQSCISALEICGLDPYEGFYHAEVYGRPALALDLMEEFRCLVVDAVVVNCASREILEPGDFQPADNGGVRLKPAAMRKFLRSYTGRMQSRVIHPSAGRAVSYQECLELQARCLRKVIEGEESEYTSIRAR